MKLSKNIILLISVLCILFATELLNAQDRFDCDKVGFDSKSMVLEEPLGVRSIDGIVVTEDGSDLLPEMCVAIFREDDQVRVGSFKLGKSQRFDFKGLQDGRYRLVVKQRNNVYCLASIPVVVSRREQKEKSIEVVMKPREIDVCSYARSIDGRRTERRTSCAEAVGDILVIAIQKQETAGNLISGTLYNCSEKAITFGTIEQNSPYIELSRLTAEPGVSGSVFHGKLPSRIFSGNRQNEPTFLNIEANRSLSFEIDLEKLGWLEASSSFIGNDSSYKLSRLPIGEYRVRILLSLIRDDAPHDPKRYRSPQFKQFASNSFVIKI